MTNDRVDQRARALATATAAANEYLSGVDRRPVAPDRTMRDGPAALGGPLAEGACDAAEVVRLLAKHGSLGTVASAGPRYFGFVTGGTLPAALGAGVLAAVWDQNAGLAIMSPAAAALEEIASNWILAILGLPPTAAVGFTTGATMGNLAALAAARHALLARAGWNVEEDGLFGAPPIAVIVGEEVHVSLLKALSLLGLGRARIVRVPVDRQGGCVPIGSRRSPGRQSFVSRPAM
jgi:glutamate/tyrosine decarboxylase-like PLP-dependent enzyme